MTSVIGHDDDDWETDPNFINDVEGKSSRWGSKAVDGSGHQESVKLDNIRQNVRKNDHEFKSRQLSEMPRPSEGYGGQFGVLQDRKDQCAEGYEYAGKVPLHSSQLDHSKGFGGAFGVHQDRQDKSALGWDEKVSLSKHESQKDYTQGFGGKHGIQTDRMDKNAVGFNSMEKVTAHSSQIDYKKGFGGEFGVDRSCQDKTAVGWDHREKLHLHESQTDYKKGFDGNTQTVMEQAKKNFKENTNSSNGDNNSTSARPSAPPLPKKSTDKSNTVKSIQESLFNQMQQKQTPLKPVTTKNIIQKNGWNTADCSSARTAAAVSNNNKVSSLPSQPASNVISSANKTNEKNEEVNSLGQLRKASSLRNKFEQLAVDQKSQDSDRAREERERRRREDEELAKFQAEEERARQARIDAEWAAADSANPVSVSEDGAKVNHDNDEAQRPTTLVCDHRSSIELPVSPGRATHAHHHPSTIGVRLPYAPTPPQPSDASHNMMAKKGLLSQHCNNSIYTNDEPVGYDSNFAVKTSAAATPHSHTTGGVRVLPPDLIVSAASASIPQQSNYSPKQPNICGNNSLETGKVSNAVFPAEKVEEIPYREITDTLSVNQQLAPQQLHSEAVLMATKTVFEHVANENVSNFMNASLGQSPNLGTTTTVEGESGGSPGKQSASPQLAGYLRAVALFSYEAQESDEIGFEVGDVITDIDQVDPGWWRGLNHEAYGLFPANYVRILDD